MTITYWTNFSKRINSTKQPTGGTSITTVALKTPCSIETPVFILNGISDSINYIKWGSRYYYVTDVTWLTNNNIQVSCDLDVLATYKSNILSTKAFVEYSDYAYNVNLLDPRISTAYNTTQSTNTAAIDFTSAAGSFMLTCISQTAVAVTYICSYTTLQLLGTEISTNLTDSVADTIAKRFGSAAQCILGCTWVPFDYSGLGSPTTIHLGGWDTGISANYLWPLYNYASDVTINIPWINSGNNIARRENEHIELFLPGYGSANLTPSGINYAASLTITPYYDRTGGLTYVVKNGTGFKALFSCNCGVPVAVTQFTETVRGKLLSAVTNIAQNRDFFPPGERSKSFIRPLGLDFIANIHARVSNIGDVVSSVGGNGGGASAADIRFDPYIRITNTSYLYAEDQANMEDRYGRPEFAVHTLTNFTGYVKTNGASVDIPGYEEEKNKVCALLNGGIFIE